MAEALCSIQSMGQGSRKYFLRTSGIQLQDKGEGMPDCRAIPASEVTNWHKHKSGRWDSTEGGRLAMAARE